jgi:16S rRNA (adenine1518-N6/adenine1519-N6)-dimethyltransferase
MTGMNLSSPASVAALLKRYHLHPRRRFGQNFLVDANTLAKIVQAGDLQPGDAVVEIGAGLGVLTTALAEAVGAEGHITALEIDRDLVAVLGETVGGTPQVTVVSGDALALDWPAFLRERFGDQRAKVIANIPYNITTPLITTLLPLCQQISLAVLLVQKEVAQRMAARPGSPEYGALSVFVQYHALVEIVSTVSRRVFFPAPDVDSAVVRLRLNPAPPVSVSEPDRFFAVVRASFGQRRKSLLNALSGDPALGWTREQAAYALEQAGIDPLRRGESLSLEEFAQIAG